MLKMVLSYYEVMPEYLDSLITCFGSSKPPHHLSYSGYNTFRAVMLGITNSETHSSRAERNLQSRGPEYQLTYTLKYVRRRGSRPGEPEIIHHLGSAISQVVIHHRVDLQTGQMTWILASSSPGLGEVKDLVETLYHHPAMVFDSTADGFQSSFFIQIIICHSALDDWALYLTWLEIEIEQQVSLSLSPSSHRC
jgi:hypothetical protein